MVLTLWNFVKRHRRILSFFFCLLVVLLVNSVHNSYPDEFDNILGGHDILKGKLPYRDFFSHHGPLAYFFAALLGIFSDQSFVRFRLMTAIFYLGIFGLTLWLLRKRLNRQDTGFFFIYAPLIALASTYFWGHMFLADPLSGYMLIPAYTLLFVKLYRGQALMKADLIVVSIFSALTMLMSTTYLYESIILTLVTFVSFVTATKTRLDKALVKKVLLFALIFGLPYGLFLLYLLITGSLADYYFDAIIYNKNYYIYNYPRPPGSTSLNPIRYAIVILNNFLNNYQVLLSGITRTDLMTPFNLTMGVTNVVLWVTLLWKRKFLLFLLSFLLIVYSTVRGNPLTSQTTDYQSAVYFFITFFHASFFFWFIAKDQQGEDGPLFSGFLKFAFVGLLIYWLFTTLFFSMELWRMTYNRYMGTMPLIYDRPQVAPLINAVVPTDHYCWVGPFQFEEIYYLNCKVPSKYHWILPQFVNSPKLLSGVIADYTANRADIIVYQRYFSAFGGSADYNAFFIDFLNKNYVRLNDVNPSLQFKGSKTQDFNLDEDFNFEKNKASALVQSLKEKGYLETK